jgi:hypothetical protein
MGNQHAKKVEQKIVKPASVEEPILEPTIISGGTPVLHYESYACDNCKKKIQQNRYA